MADTFYGNRLSRHLFEGNYKGGPIAIGSARFKMGSKGRPDWLHNMVAACEGPPLEISLGLTEVLESQKMGSYKNITLLSLGEYIASAAAVINVKQFLHMVVAPLAMGDMTHVNDIYTK